MIEALYSEHSPLERFKVVGSYYMLQVKKQRKKLKEQLQESTLTLIKDGWLNMRNDPIMATSIHTGKK